MMKCECTVLAELIKGLKTIAEPSAPGFMNVGDADGLRHIAKRLLENAEKSNDCSCEDKNKWRFVGKLLKCKHCGRIIKA